MTEKRGGQIPFRKQHRTNFQKSKVAQEGEVNFPSENYIGQVFRVSNDNKGGVVKFPFPKSISNKFSKWQRTKEGGGGQISFQKLYNRLAQLSDSEKPLKLWRQFCLILKVWQNFVTANRQQQQTGFFMGVYL